MESSTETLTEEACSRLELPPQPPVCLGRQPCSEGRSHPPCSRKEKGLEAGEHSYIRTLNGAAEATLCQCLSVCECWPQPGKGFVTATAPKGGSPVESPTGPKGTGSGPLWVDRCPSQAATPWSSTRGAGCSHHRCCHSLLSRAAISPEQPSRNHLDDDGLTLHNDAIQQRLRQIEAGHQMEVETLKKQVQELWSRLENQQHTGSHRVNGDLGDEVVRCWQVDGENRLFTTRT